ncbi:hypothetical protein ES707_01405 [subsurface metagenome]
MPEVGIVNFDDEGNLHTNKVTVTAEELGVNCWLPARFLGGQCDRYYTCKYAEKANCQAGPSGIAREKAKHEELEEGEELRQDLICALCGEPIVPRDPGDRPYTGDTGTAYEGKPVCDTCYDEDTCEPAATIYYGGDHDEPHLIGSCRNETEGDFQVKWHSTDPWRGYHECESDGYVEVFTDAILSGHESEEMLKKLYDRVLERFDEEDIGFARVFCRSSNVFMTSLEIWVKRDFVQLLKAHAIIAQARGEVDYDNPLYSTGILFPRENLEKFKKLLGKKYNITTDKDLADLAAREGEDLLGELIEAAKGG